eukprot:TRINITY_DN9228_c0_g1_i1.p1 TRINITY_DN9228_c0_g1~~TRINITY_DN9228_c0_g1_i1.p1  ORF type:complete len:448 (-),score=56.15 TRINITY_DN9228_c0_g1_i1:150-1493(-)
MPLTVARVLPWKWDSTSGSWVEDRDPPEVASLESFTTLSYNVWFQDAGKANKFDGQWLPRQRALMRVCHEASADIFCFQEVTTPRDFKDSFMELFLQENWVRESYWVSDVTGRQTFTTWYGVMIASRVPIRYFSFAPFPNSKMGRCLLVAHLNTAVGCETVAVGSVHFESMNSAPERFEQLRESCDFLETHCQTGLLLGDFNVEEHEKQVCARHWESRGWSDIDPGGSSWFGWNWRPDHTILRSGIYTGSSVIMGNEHCGVQTTGHDGPVKTPSDHYAIKSSFVKKSAIPESPHLSPSRMKWSLDNTQEIAPDKVLQAQVFAGTQAPTEAVKMFNADPALWPNLLGQCYVRSSYNNTWYLMWSGDAKQPLSELPCVSEKGDWREWSLQQAALTAPEAVPAKLMFQGAQGPTEAVEFLNADRNLWPNLVGECYVWSAYKAAWYRMWPQ